MQPPRSVARIFTFPTPRAERDALIAATALVHGLTVVTRNVEGFELVGVPLFNPWDVRVADKPE
jgi:predicted nucleic acid-binding protein